MSRINPKELTKLYYTIGEVAQLFDVNTSLIRFWEKEFSAIKPKKNNKGNRLFTVKDILTIDQIYELVKVEGHTLDGARKSLRERKSSKPKETTVQENAVPSQKDYQEVIDRLEALKKKILKMKP
ncbi:MAG: MerR family transcriptional regulator [Flavobacteriales bacterium]|nr:MerR family transcriptional regulator [Flavobacteriales bacterium]